VHNLPTVYSNQIPAGGQKLLYTSAMLFIYRITYSEIKLTVMRFSLTFQH
jgi:hypothetical protein